MSAVGCALGSVAFDHAVGTSWIKNIGWVFGGRGGTARAACSSAISGSVMTVVSIVFSLTIATLSQTSSHYGPRVLRNFTSDRRGAVHDGHVHRHVRLLLASACARCARSTSPSFVPYLSVTIGVRAGARLAGSADLLHPLRLPETSRPRNLIAEVGVNLQKVFETVFPEEIGDGRERKNPPDPSVWLDARRVDARESGYLQRVDEDALMRLATQYDLQLRLEKRPGEFVGQGHSLLAHPIPPSAENDEIAENLRECFSLGTYRTRHQDAMFSLQQLVEIAAHALSPGINEPFTALTCIDWLGSGLRGVITPRPARPRTAATLTANCAYWCPP